MSRLINAMLVKFEVAPIVAGRAIKCLADCINFSKDCKKEHPYRSGTLVLTQASRLL